MARKRFSGAPPSTTVSERRRGRRPGAPLPCADRGFYCLALALSLSFSLRNAAQRYEELALFTARSFFQQVVVTRRWNALHAGVYVPVTEDTQPNLHLEDPRRDVVTTDGVKPRNSIPPT